MDLILWRHAEAVYGIPDMDRALTPKGERQARKMADYLLSRLPPETRILASPARRAQQTAAALGRNFVTMPELAPDVHADAILRAAGWPHAEGCVVVVGHQPTLGVVAARLLMDADAGLSVRKGSIWWLSSRYRTAEAQGVLRLMMSPDML